MSTRTPRDLLRCALLALPLCACNGTHGGRLDEIEELTRAHDRLLAEFAAGQAQFRARNPMPLRREVQGIGTLVVHEAELAGRLGQEMLYVQFTWVNSTGRSTNGARVRVALRDAVGGVQREERVDMRSLLGTGFGPDCTYTSFVFLPMEGLHREAGWDWGIEVEAVPPVLGG